MNKKLIAAAVAGACIAPAAMAQTANPVTLYGRIYGTLESVEAKGGAAPVVRRNRVDDQSSLLGVRGTEDLGGGLKAFFQLETAFRVDQNTTTFAARNSAVGLQGGFGSIFVGRWDMPFKTATIAIDPYGDLTNSGIIGVLSDRGNFDVRAQNIVQYWTNNYSGFAARVALGANEGKTATLNPRQNGANITYSGGPLYAFVAWEEHRDVSATLTKEEGLAVGASFVLPQIPVKLGAQYQEFKKTNLTKQKSYMANVVWSIGKNDLIYQYMNSKDGAASGAAQPDCSSNSVAWQYNFSKRTFFIASYVKVDNNDNATCNFGANALTIAKGQDPQSVWTGLRHVF